MPEGPQLGGKAGLSLHRRCFSPVLEDLCVQMDFPSLPLSMA